MFTDMVGYTALGQRNESLSLALVEEQRKLIRPILSRHSGKEIKTMGDAFLVEFPSALDAVRCAYDIQRATREFNISLPDEKRIHLRVGVHLGDVVESRGDISGDAVNVASRIESLAEDGGVCVTCQVYDHIQNKFELKLASLGVKPLKNVSMPIEVYRMVMPWEEEKAIPSALLDRRRIAVLPFTNISPDPADEYFADGMTEELISTMSRISGMKVIARTSIMGYKGGHKKVDEVARELGVGTVLEGSVRKAGNRIRITVQLIDSETSEHMWAESYDRELEDVFAVQSDISKTVAEALKVRLLPIEKERVEKVPTKNVQAYELYLKGLETAPWFEAGYPKENIERSRDYFERAVQLDPYFALAYAGLEDCYMHDYRYRAFDERAPKAENAAHKALEIDPDLAEAHIALGDALWHRYDFQGCEKEWKRAIELKPNSALAHEYYGAGLCMIFGKFEEAETELRKARELDPLSSSIRSWFQSLLYNSHQYDRALEEIAEEMKLHDSPGLHNALAGIYLVKGDYDNALIESEKAMATVSPDDRPFFISTLACIYAKTGRKEEAVKILNDLEELCKQRHYATYYDAFAPVYYCLGDYDGLFRTIQNAYDEHSGDFLFSLIDPLYDSLRTDPRFIALLKRVGLQK
jgi:TolB-like protein/tetratricopeptide (TPR) repeat protein